MDRESKTTSLEDMAMYLAHTAYTLYSASLSGNQNKRQEQVYNFTNNPDIGSLVFEKTFGVMSLYRGNKEGVFKSLGFLKSITEEPIDMEWNEKEDGPHPKEKIFYITNLDGKETRWTNCGFIAIPTKDILQ